MDELAVLFVCSFTHLMQFSAAFLTFTFIFIVDKIVQGKTEVFSFVIIYTERQQIYLHII